MIKVGDKVKVLLTNRELALQNSYRGRATEGSLGKVIRVGVSGTIKLDIDKNSVDSWIKVESVKLIKGIPRKNCDLIKAWADGATIQYQNRSGTWVDCANNRPTWSDCETYREKPDNSAKISELEQKMRELADEIAALK